LELCWIHIFLGRLVLLVSLAIIAGDGPELQDHVIEQGIIKPLLTDYT
jgi:hypothetical protein